MFVHTPSYVDSPDGLRAFQSRVKRGIVWRSGFLIADFIGLAWLSLSLDAIRLYTIATAPSYVPMGVVRYWASVGAFGGAGLVLVAETTVYAWRTREFAARVFPKTLVQGQPVLQAVSRPPPGL
jgi:hypothetical protein